MDNLIKRTPSFSEDTSLPFPLSNDSTNFYIGRVIYKFTLRKLS